MTNFTVTFVSWAIAIFIGTIVASSLAMVVGFLIAFIEKAYLLGYHFL